MSAKCEEMVITEEPRGKGVPLDPIRLVRVVYAKDGTLLAERDSQAPAYDRALGCWVPRHDSAVTLASSPTLASEVFSISRLEEDLRSGAAARLKLDQRERELESANASIGNLRAIRDQLLGFLDARPDLRRAWAHYQRKHPVALVSAAPRRTLANAFRPV